MALAALFDGSVLVAQYRPFPKSTEFQVILSIYSRADNIINGNENLEWNRKILWEVGLHGLGDDMIEPESLHLMYFLTTPILKANNENSKVVFVFLGRIFTLEFENGWIIRADRVDYLSGTELDVDLISFIESDSNQRQQVALVSDVSNLLIKGGQLFILSDKKRTRNVFEEYFDWIFSSDLTSAQTDFAFNVVTGFDFFFDIPDILQLSVQDEFNLPQRHWNLLGAWSTAMVGLPKAVIK